MDKFKVKIIKRIQENIPFQNVQQSIIINVPINVPIKNYFLNAYKFHRRNLTLNAYNKKTHVLKLFINFFSLKSAKLKSKKLQNVKFSIFITATFSRHHMDDGETR